MLRLFYSTGSCALASHIALEEAGNKTPCRGKDRLENVPAFRAVVLDLHDQDHRVLGNHADQREDAEDGHEAERPVKQQ